MRSVRNHSALLFQQLLQPSQRRVSQKLSRYKRVDSIAADIPSINRNDTVSIAMMIVISTVMDTYHSTHIPSSYRNVSLISHGGGGKNMSVRV